MAQVAEAHRLDGRSHRVFDTLSYAAETWDRPRRVIVKAEHLVGGDGGKPNPRFVVTNLAGDPQELYESAAGHRGRGDAENRIKDQQPGLFADRTSCHDFLANQYRVLVAAAAYVPTITSAAPPSPAPIWPTPKSARSGCDSSRSEPGSSKACDASSSAWPPATPGPTSSTSPPIGS